MPTKGPVGSSRVMAATLLILVVTTATALLSVPSVFPVVEASTNERNKYFAAKSAPKSSFVRSGNQAVFPPSSRIPTVLNSTATAVTESTDFEVTSTLVPNENGTSMYYMTTTNDHHKRPQRSSILLYEIDVFIQEKVVPLLLRRQQQQQTDAASMYYLPSMVVGVLTAAVGFGYVRLLGHCRSLLWNTLPRALSDRVSSIPAVLFIAGMTTLGGGLLGYITTHQSTPVYSASDFVSTMSAYENDEQQQPSNDSTSTLLPSARQHLLPLLGMCLLTSSFGIPLGPEAPMVGAGTLVGAAVAKYLNRNNSSASNRKDLEHVLAYAGASGALTGAMGIPIVGTIFALEMVHSSSGMGKAASKVMSPSILSSLVAIVALRLLWTPASLIGGHFDYFVQPHGTVLNHAITGRAMILTAIASGLGGSLLGTTFHKLYAFTKKLLWKPTNGNEQQHSKQRKLAVRAIIGLVIGLIATFYPQSLFWGEGSLQSYIDGQHTPFGQTSFGLPSFLYRSAIVDPSAPYGSAWAALQVAFAKCLAIILAGAGKFSGGIVFPLFAAAPAFVHVFAPWLAGLGHHRMTPIAVMCTMAATQASATRTPLASALILALSASATTELSVMVPACLISSYCSIFASQWLSKHSYFHYHENERRWTYEQEPKNEKYQIENTGSHLKTVQ
ncbi:chloride channel [Nitzschia inconspicua]|uniref:Chloride channel n=1 Tax=Nitzschia inconspicua TaxID=303405 RepID=A0A9K3LHZ3_9STRA|nr:chloride channel [Nitzschia inconspicua]